MQENLARGLQVVSRAVSARSTLPVLSNVLLRTEDGGLKLTATNLEIAITHWVPGKIDEDGATTVPAKLLTDLVNSLPSSERVDLELQAGSTLQIRSGRFQTHVKGLDAEEFPAVATAGERPTTRIPQRALRGALSQTAFAAASDEARPILTGVLARFEGDRLTLAAADNYRIAVRKLPVLDTVADVSVVIPARALNELARILADTDDPVEVLLAQARNQVLFRLDGVDLVSRLIDGQFPNYQQVIPKEFKQRIQVDTEGLLHAVRRVAAIEASRVHADGQLGLLADGAESRRLFFVADAAWLMSSILADQAPPRISGLVHAATAQYAQTLHQLHLFQLRHPEVGLIPSHCAETVRRWEQITRV